MGHSPASRAPYTGVRIFVYEMFQDDRRKCTAAKLRRLGIARQLRRPSMIPRSAIVLNPYSERAFAPTDRSLVRDYGLVAVDCSWKRASPRLFQGFPGKHRRLPLVLAGNPVNYAQLARLSSAEALAAALYISGFLESSIRVLSLFKWGNTFLTLNREALEDYRKGDGPADIESIEKQYFGMVQPSILS